MNGIEVAKLPNGIEEYVASFKPVTAIRWNTQTGKYEVDDSPERLQKTREGFEKFVEAVRDVHDFGQFVTRGTPKFCLSLKRIFEGLRYVEAFEKAEYGTYADSGIMPPMTYSTDCNFIKIVGQLGISESTAYRYKDFAEFVDPETGNLYPVFEGYSFSLLSEILAFYRKFHGYVDLESLKKTASKIPADTTIDDMRLYCKAMRELETYGDSLFKDYSYEKRAALKKKQLPEVIKVYQDLLQKAEAKKLETTLSGVKEVAKNDKSEKVLPASDEMIVKRSDYQKINALAEKALNIGACAGCKHKGVNLNKCRCCRRYESLKDLFETE